MPPPRNRPVPRFAPEGSITLISALDILGRAVDPAWTGEEIKADTAPDQRPIASVFALDPVLSAGAVACSAVPL
jgi:hypothetical protein